MKRLETLLPWLAVSALFEWLVGRTFARAAIFMPKPDGALPVYQGLEFISQLAASLTGLLALVVLAWIAWHNLSQRKNLALGLTFFALILFGLLGLFYTTGNLLVVFFQVGYIFALLMLTWQSWKSAQPSQVKLATSLVALTLLAGRLYQLLPLISADLGASSPPGAARLFFNSGELLVALSVLALWWCYGRGATVGVWLCALLSGLLFTLPHLLNPAIIGVMAIWSTGLSLYLPWPVYTIALILACVTTIQALRRGSPAGWAVVLLAAGGYAPQLSAHAMLGLIALWVLLEDGNPAFVEQPSSYAGTLYTKDAKLKPGSTKELI